MYEGHSWASGLSTFRDGNNQESVSEAINAYAAINRYSRLINNEKSQNFSNYLVSQEIVAAKLYWFNLDNNLLVPTNSGFNYNFASIIWGGKIDSSTWFSPKIEAKLAILLLPLNEYSSYLVNSNIYDKVKNDLDKETKGIYTDYEDILNTYIYINGGKVTKPLPDWKLDDGSSYSYDWYIINKLSNSSQQSVTSSKTSSKQSTVKKK
jgi:endoglucanase Acf2